MKVITRTDKLSRAEWLDLRRKGIGGSDAGTIMGANRYTSAFTLHHQKTGAISDEWEGNEATRWGHDLELVIAKRFAEETQSAVVSWPVLLQSDVRPWQLANLDFLIVEPSDWCPPGEVTVVHSEPEDVLGILEIKTTGIASKGSAHEWAYNNIPASYYYQGCHYASVTEIANVTFAALVGGQGLVIREVTYKPGQISELNEKEADFWENVQADLPPVPDGLPRDFDTLKLLYPNSELGKTLQADEQLANVIERFKKAKQMLDEVQSEFDEAKAQLLDEIGNAESVELNGETILTYKSSKMGTTFDTKSFAASYPEIYKQFVSNKPGFRTLRLKDNDA